MNWKNIIKELGGELFQSKHPEYSYTIGKGESHILVHNDPIFHIFTSAKYPQTVFNGCITEEETFKIILNSLGI